MTYDLTDYDSYITYDSSSYVLHIPHSQLPLPEVTGFQNVLPLTPTACQGIEVHACIWGAILLAVSSCTFTLYINVHLLYHILYITCTQDYGLHVQYIQHVKWYPVYQEVYSTRVLSFRDQT